MQATGGTLLLPFACSRPVLDQASIRGGVHGDAAHARMGSKEHAQGVACCCTHMQAKESPMHAHARVLSPMQPQATLQGGQLAWGGGFICPMQQRGCGESANPLVHAKGVRVGSAEDEAHLLGLGTDEAQGRCMGVLGRAEEERPTRSRRDQRMATTSGDARSQGKGRGGPGGSLGEAPVFAAGSPGLFAPDCCSQ